MFSVIVLQRKFMIIRISIGFKKKEKWSRKEVIQFKINLLKNIEKFKNNIWINISNIKKRSLTLEKRISMIDNKLKKLGNIIKLFILESIIQQDGRKIMKKIQNIIKNLIDLKTLCLGLWRNRLKDFGRLGKSSKIKNEA